MFADESSGDSKGFFMVSFGYMQQLLLPFYPDQAYPLYFLTGRKIKVVGVTNEGLRSQRTYLSDEGTLSNKGANSVVSMLDH